MIMAATKLLPPEYIAQVTLFNSVVAVTTGALNGIKPDSTLISSENITKINEVLSQSLDRIKAIYNS
jgi:hypothetical protein